MTPEHIRLVQESWKQLQPSAPQAAGLFYSRLFALDPSVRRLFRTDLKEQGARLMAMISVAVGGLSRLENLVPAVQDLGRRHARYGVEERHYSVVGAALVWTLQQQLGKAFTTEVEQAWRTVYGVLATTMQQAAASQEIA
jgi:hemoglobin-like flavoprotein